jgi:uncharacterized protein (TIGR00725 family)
MASAAAGARSLDGLVVGVLPGSVGGTTDLSVAIATGMGEARNAILVRSADAVIVIGGSWGTLSEVALAMRRQDDAGTPRVVTLGGWRVLDSYGRPVPGILEATDPDHAVALAFGS